MAGEITTEDGDAGDEVDSTFNISWGLDLLDGNIVTAEDEKFPVVIENLTDEDIPFEISFRINCPSVYYDEVTYFTSSESFAKQSMWLDAVFNRRLLTPDGNDFYCQVFPIIEFENNLGQPLREHGGSIFIKFNEKTGELDVLSQEAFFKYVDSIGAIPRIAKTIKDNTKVNKYKKGSKSTVSIRLNLKWKVDYDDASTAIGDDYFTSNADQSARGAYVIVKRADNYWSRPYEGYVSETGYTPWFNVDSTVNYIVDMYSTSEINGNLIVVKECAVATCDYTQATTGYDLSGFSYYIYHAASQKFASSATYYINNGTATASSNTIAAATYTIYRHRDYQTNNDYLILHENNFNLGWINYHEGINGQSQIRLTCFSSGSGGGVVRKYTIGHEMGHAFLYNANGQTSVWENTTYTGGGAYCNADPEHSIVTKEYQSGGLGEGWAHFFSASTWNNTSQSDCKFRYYKNVDHDADGTVSTNPTINCEAGDYAGGQKNPPLPLNRQYMHNYCTHYTRNDNRYSNEWDWLLTFWNLVTDYGSAADYVFIADMLTGVSGDWNDNEYDLFCRLRTAGRAINTTTEAYFALTAEYYGVANFNSTEANCPY